jgi:tetratricopeptide (TPR) repeat protein
LIAGNYRSIGQIEMERQNFDAAVVSFQRALLIYEDLERLEPNNRWSESLAETARDLAEVLRKRGDSQSAFMHAENAVRISRDAAERYSAHSETRINHARSLELVAQLARDVANRDPERSESYFKRAVANLVGANAIRESVLVVDPSRGECRCQVGRNHMELADIYEDWGKTAERLEAFNHAVQVYRELMQNEPEVRQWHYTLANSLYKRAEAISGQSKNNHEAVLADYRESSTLLRDLPGVSDSKEMKEMLINSLIGVSFNALLVRRDEEALAAAEEALKLSPGDLRILINQAHALMYLERADEALRIYQEHKGKPLLSDTWEKSVADDFAELKAARGAHLLMDLALKEMGIEPTHPIK